MEIMKNYKNIFNLVSDSVYIRKKDTIIFSNSAASKILSGSSNNNLQGVNINKLIRPMGEYVQTYEKFLEKIEEGEEVKSVYLKVIRSYDGKVLDIELSGKKIIYYDEEAYLQIIKNVSEKLQAQRYMEEYKRSQKLLKEVKNTERAQRDFFTNLSHELRTPLNVIMGIVQLQEQACKAEDLSILKDSYKKYNEVIRQNCYRLLKMINNVLDITKIEAGYLKLNLENRDIVSTVENITMSVVDYAKLRGINIIFDTDTEEKIMAFDADYMERIILNLLSNAIKFTPAGKNIYVTIKDLIDTIIISVRDEGEGIPQDKQEVIFNRFIQASSDDKKRRNGTGIGLSLVKSLVELHQGAVKLSSKEGKGSEFIIYLPYTLVEEKMEEVSAENLQDNKEQISIEFSDIYDLDS
ncbi:Sensor protein DivL [Clostridium sp. N3C]|uniref:PAS domain-containing sensor histidine kinase n=1 Tax=Clostridium sp. N3C TaxID=1776758 RepID=UPI00092DF22D|nr:PAS domain-containing sensor histidine kinase [Clostridium sp. N3C]SCN23499.1 Sensor protein DivL [Clostridium sp. N3C]